MTDSRDVEAGWPSVLSGRSFALEIIPVYAQMERGVLAGVRGIFHEIPATCAPPGWRTGVWQELGE